ncbi:MAG: CheR family methyltransferase [Acidimicrobiales bacterium]
MPTSASASTDEDFAHVRSLLRQRAAIVVDDSKDYLIRSRLQPIAHANGFGSLGDLLGELRRRPTGELSDRVVDAMTTNETSWLRDIHPFETLAEHVIPEVAAAKSGPIQIWSAACSSGQEPYSIAMLVTDRHPALASRVKIYATDVSASMLDKASSGTFTQLEANRGLSTQQLMRHFRRKGAHWELNPTIRQMVRFESHNLDGPFAGIPRSDIVLVRNVMIYFDTPTKQSILQKVRSVLQPDGWLVLGASETTVGVDATWRRTVLGKSTFYRPS